MNKLEYRLPNMFPDNDLVVFAESENKDISRLGRDLSFSKFDLLIESPYTTLLLMLYIVITLTLFLITDLFVFPAMVMSIAVVCISQYAIMADVEYAVEQRLKWFGYSNIKLRWHKR